MPRPVPLLILQFQPRGKSPEVQRRRFSHWVPGRLSCEESQEAKARVPFPLARRVDEFFCIKWDILVHSGVLPLRYAGLENTKQDLRCTVSHRLVRGTALAHECHWRHVRQSPSSCWHGLPALQQHFVGGDFHVVLRHGRSCQKV